MRFRDDAREIRAEAAALQADAGLESARRLSAEDDSLWGTVQRELEQVRRMRQDLRREPQPRSGRPGGGQSRRRQNRPLLPSWKLRLPPLRTPHRPLAPR